MSSWEPLQSPWCGLPGEGKEDGAGPSSTPQQKAGTLGTGTVGQERALGTTPGSPRPSTPGPAVEGKRL